MKDEQTFSKNQRILTSGEYARIWREGRRYHTAHFVVIVNPGGSNSRLGLTVSRKVGNAVCRNKLKRRLRELFRCNYKLFVRIVDLSIVAKRTAGHLTYLQVEQELLSVFARLETDDHV